MPMTVVPVEDERQGLLAFLEQQRQAVRNAVYGLSDEDARLKPTASALSLGGLVTHLVGVEEGWTDRVEEKPVSQASVEDYMAGFTLPEGRTLSAALVDYEKACARTDTVMSRVEDLSQPVPLPPQPWYPKGCTVRWVLLHLIEETARHAGHADIIREALDGAQAGSLMAAVEGWPENEWVKPWRPKS